MSQQSDKPVPATDEPIEGQIEQEQLNDDNANENAMVQNEEVE